jgi:hypothetical protein
LTNAEPGGAGFAVHENGRLRGDEGPALWFGVDEGHGDLLQLAISLTGMAVARKGGGISCL